MTTRGGADLAAGETAGGTAPPPPKKRKTKDEIWRTNDSAMDYLVAWLGESADENGAHYKAISGVLDNNDVVTVDHLKSKVADPQSDVDIATFAKWCSFEQFGPLFRQFYTQIQQPETAEDILDGKLFNLLTGRPLNEGISGSRLFVVDACNVKEPESDAVRSVDDDINIVLGPSGSGKTMYVVNHLALPTSGKKPQTPKKHVSFYLNSPDIANMIRDEATRVKTSTVFAGTSRFMDRHEEQQHPAPLLAGAIKKYTRDQTPKEAVTEVIKNLLGKAIYEASGKVWNEKDELGLHLTLILDEAAGLGGLFGKIEVLKGIIAEIDCVANSARLVVAGTGYEKISRTLSSKRDVLKYRMQPWEPSHLKAAANKVLKNRVTEKVKHITEVPVLRKLITNARAAFFALKAVELFWGLRDTTENGTPALQGLVGSIINYALASYVSMNGMADLSPDERRELAYAVFREIDVSNRFQEARFPEFDIPDLPAKIKRQALGVLDVHVETDDGMVDFVGEHTSILLQYLLR